MKKNLIFIVIDALRYDRIGTHGYKYSLTPNLDKIITSGQTINNHFANGCPTQMSFPSILSSTYCLDYGGYNLGINNRPSTLAEFLNKKNYQTFGITTAHPSGSHFGYNRGFDYFENLLDLYQWFRQNLKVFIREALNDYKKKKISHEEMLNYLLTHYQKVLLSTLEYIEEIRNYNLTNNKWNLIKLKKKVNKEIQILNKNPKIILEKFIIYDYWYFLFLGDEKISKIRFLFHNLKENIRLKINSVINLFPRRRIYNCNQVFDRFFEIKDKKKNNKKPFFFFLHIFDIHEAKNFVLKFSLFFIFDVIKLLILRKFKFGGFIYDLAVMSVDREIGKFVSKLKKQQMEKNSILIITSDHGMVAGPPVRENFSKYDLSNYFYDEFIKVPFIIYPRINKKKNNNQISSHLDMGPTIIDLLNLEKNMLFKGSSIFEKKKKNWENNTIISETNGSGICNLKKKPFYICIRSMNLKVVYEIKNNIIKERDVFNMLDDPEEINNIVSINKNIQDRIFIKKIAEQRVKEIMSYEKYF